MTEWIVSSCVLIAVVALLRRILRGKMSLRLQYALWALVLVRLLLPITVGESGYSVAALLEKTPAVQEEQPPADITVSIPPSKVGYEIGGYTPDLAIPDPGLYPSTQQYQQAVEDYEATLEQSWLDYKAENTRHITFEISDVLYALWGVGMVAVAVWLLAVNLRFGAGLRRSRRPLAAEDCPLPVYVTPAAETPCLFGLFRPAVYITPEAAEDPAVLRHVLAHETTHFRHGDHVWATLRCLCLVLHWYNPLVWLAAALSRRDCELACDESAIRVIGEGERAAYGRTLIGLTCTGRGGLIRTATTMTGSKKGIRERITLIARKPKMAVYTLIAVLLIAAAAAGCTFTGPEGETDVPVADAREEMKYGDTFGESILVEDYVAGYLDCYLMYTAPSSDIQLYLKNCTDRTLSVGSGQGVYLYTREGEKLERINFPPDDGTDYSFTDVLYQIEPDHTIILDIPFTDGNIFLPAGDYRLVYPAVWADGSGDEVKLTIDFSLGVEPCCSTAELPPEVVDAIAQCMSSQQGLEHISGVKQHTTGVADLIGNHVEVYEVAFGHNASHTVRFLILAYGADGSCQLTDILTVEMMGVRFGTSEMIAEYGNMYTAAAASALDGSGEPDFELFVPELVVPENITCPDSFLSLPQPAQEGVLAYLERAAAVAEERTGCSVTQTVVTELENTSLGVVGLTEGNEMYRLDFYIRAIDGNGNEIVVTDVVDACPVNLVFEWETTQFGNRAWAYLFSISENDFVKVVAAVAEETGSDDDEYNRPHALSRLVRTYKSESDQRDQTEIYEEMLTRNTVDDWYNAALGCIFSSPEEIDLGLFFYEWYRDLSSWDNLSPEEVTFLTQNGFVQALDVQKRPAEKLEEILQQYFGLSLSQMTIPDNWLYFPDTDSYYTGKSDTYIVTGIDVTEVEETDGIVRIYYTVESDNCAYEPETGRMVTDAVLTLEKTDDGRLLIRSNEIRDP